MSKKILCFFDVRNVCGCRHFCIFEILCELPPTILEGPRTRSPEARLLSLFFEFCGESRQFPGVGSSLHSGAGLGHVRDESFGGYGEDELVPEFGDNPGTTGSLKFSVLQRIFFSCLVKGGF